MANNPAATEWKLKILDRLRDELCSRHYCRWIEETHCFWVKRYCHFHNLRHPAEIGETKINAFLTNLMVKERGSASTRNQALSALIFLYRHVLNREVREPGEVIRSRKPHHLPVVMTREGVKAVQKHLNCYNWLMAITMYGAGLRLMECFRLRVQNIDFSRNEILVRDGNGAKDRITMIPEFENKTLIIRSIIVSYTAK